MAIRTVFAGVALVGLVSVGGCDDVDAGRGADDPTPPSLLHVLVLDWTAPLAIDLLEQEPPAPCDDLHPCPVAAMYVGPVCLPDVDGGPTYCQSPTAARTPMTVGAPWMVGAPGIEVRLVVSKPLDAARLEQITDGFALSDPAAVQVVPAGGGAPLAVAASFYDPSGNGQDTVDHYEEPLGPAVVIDLAAPLTYASRFAVVVRGAALVDRQGRAVTTDIHGALPTSYPFRTVDPPKPMTDGGP